MALFTPAQPPLAPGVQFPPRRQARHALLILFLGYMLAFVDRNVVSLLVVPIEHDLGLSDLQMGLLRGTAFAIFYSIFGFPIAWLVDRYNRRNIVLGGIAVWSLMTVLAGLSRNFMSFFGARVGVGAGEAAILPSATSLIADYFPPEKRGRAMGVFASGIFIGTALALIGGGLLLDRLHGQVTVLPLRGALQPWQVVLVAAGLLGIPLFVAALFVREPPRLYLHGRTMAQAAEQSAGFFETFRQHPRAFGAHFIGFTALCFASYGATSWLPTLFMREHHWSALQVGARLGIMALLLGPLGAIIGGVIADRMEKTGRRAGKFIVGATAAALTIVPALVMGLSGNAWVTYAAAAVLTFCISLIWGVAPGALQEIAHGAVLGRVVAAYTALINLVGLGLAPPSIALLGESIAGKNAGLGTAIAIVIPLACVIALVAFASSMGAYRQARADLKP